jgi:RimJ/RimL family protein N-acetyltransferase
LVDDIECGEDLSKRAGTIYNPKVDHNFCRVKEAASGRYMLGGVVFNHFTGESIQIHCGAWTQYWLNRDLLFMIFDYPFNQLGVKRMFGQIRESNWDAQVFCMKFGFKPVARIEGVFRHGDACVIVCLERDDWRFKGVKPRNYTVN